MEKEMSQHLIKEGSRSHVLSYSDRGVHCNVDGCEVNEVVDSGGKNPSELVVGTSKKEPAAIKRGNK